jgi:hypothetical protein
MSEPIICFGQQPNGFFPKRFFYAKVATAKKLQKQIGGEIVFFYHDSDADWRETVTALIDKQTGKEARINFEVKNKLQKKHSPLYAKQIAPGWQEKILRVLPQYVQPELIDLVGQIKEKTVANFSLDAYTKMGLIEGMKIIRSSDPEFREQAETPADYFVDVEYEGEIVRARAIDKKLVLHEGGNKHIELPFPEFKKSQVSAARDSRFPWMQSVIKCTHYIYGEGEKDYLDTAKFPEIKFVDREKIENAERAWTEMNSKQLIS